MDKVKIGKFIRKQRKEKEVTETDLAHKLHISPKTVIKWEDGEGLPDSSIIPLLCEILGITVNDLFSGEIVDRNDSNVKCELNLMEIKKELEDSNRRLLIAEIFIAFISVLSFVLIILCSSRVNSMLVKVCMILGGVFILAIGIFISIRIERTAGYYECIECHYKYKPTLKQNLLSMHMGWTKRLRCPHCGKKTWNKKILTK